MFTLSALYRSGCTGQFWVFALGGFEVTVCVRVVGGLIV